MEMYPTARARCSFPISDLNFSARLRFIDQESAFPFSDLQALKIAILASLVSSRLSPGRFRHEILPPTTNAHCPWPRPDVCVVGIVCHGLQRNRSNMFQPTRTQHFFSSF